MSNPDARRRARGRAASAARRLARRAFPVVSLGIGVAVVVVVARRSGANAGEVVNLLPRWAHLAAIGIMAIELSARTLRWVVIGRGAGVPLTFRTAALAQVAGEAAGAITPARVGVDPAKLMFGSRDSKSLGGIGAVIAGELVAEAVVLIVLGIFLAIISTADVSLPVFGVIGYAVMMGGGAAAVVALVALRSTARPPRMWSLFRLSRRQWRALRRNGLRLIRHVGALRRIPPRGVVAVGILTAIHIAARLAVLPVLAFAAGAEVPLLPLVTWALFLLYTTTLVPSPGSGGTVEIGFTVALGALLPGGALAGLLIWWRFYTFYLGALVGGLAVALSGARGRRRDRRAARALVDGAEGEVDRAAA